MIDRKDAHSFAGYDVIVNAKGNLSVMVPFRNAKGQKNYRAEGDFRNRKELAEYCHGKLIAWGKI